MAHHSSHIGNQSNDLHWKNPHDRACSTNQIASSRTRQSDEHMVFICVCVAIGNTGNRPEQLPFLSPTVADIPRI